MEERAIMSRRAYLSIVFATLGLGLLALGVFLLVRSLGGSLPLGVHVIDLRKPGQTVPKKTKGQRIIVIGKCASLHPLLPGTLVAVGSGHMFQCRMRDESLRIDNEATMAIEGEMDVEDGWPGEDMPLMDGFVGVPLKDCVILPYRP